MMPSQAATPAPIHDIAGPVPITSLPLAWTVGGGHCDHTARPACRVVLLS